MARTGALHLILGSALRVAPRAVTFEEVVAEFQDDVFGAALRILGDRDAAAEAASATFIKAYRGFHRYEPARPLRNWLLTIAVREAISLGRRRGRERARRGPAEAAEGVRAPRGLEPEERLLDREERQRIRVAVAALPERYRVPVVLRYFNDLSLEEIAQVIRRPRSTVGVRLLRARAMLRRSLGGAEP